MVTLLIILMMACNLWVLFYLTCERKEERTGDFSGKAGKEEQQQKPLADIMGKSLFRMPERTPQVEGHRKPCHRKGRITPSA